MKELSSSNCIGPSSDGSIYFFFDYVSSVLLMFIVDNEIDENNKE